MIRIEIDSESGFCFGVTTAINKAEEKLREEKTLYCLGDIVHNGMECERLRAMGLVTINHDELSQLHDVKVMLRAHGEPPRTYEVASQQNIEIVDTTCPVVLQLQKRIKKQFDNNPEAQIVIFGKNGHAEVLGLVGQTNNRAIVVENINEVISIENTQQFHGLYHVLGGVISPMDGVGPSDLAIDELVARLEAGGIKEVILALSPTMEGDTTNFYLYKKLSKYDVEISTIARGVSIGDELEYADEVTLGRSIVNRTPYKL